MLEQIYELLPRVLSVGVSYRDFWYLNMKDIYYIFKGYEISFKEKQELVWLSGLYIQNAIASCLSKNIKYPKSPSKLEEERKMFNEDGSMKDEYIAQSLQDYFARFGGDNIG